MKLGRVLAGAAIALGASLVGVDGSQARIVTVTYTGGVSAKHDPLNLFGPQPVVVLDNDSFTETFTIDLSAAPITIVPGISAGIFGSGPSPVIVSDVLTIKGLFEFTPGVLTPGAVSINIPLGGDGSDQLSVDSSAPYTRQFISGDSVSYVGNTKTTYHSQAAVVYNKYTKFPSGPSLTDSFTIPNTSILATAGVDITSFNPDTNYYLDSYIKLSTRDVTVKGGVPEPATWAVMLLGFGGIGASMRNRRRKQAAVAA